MTVRSTLVGLALAAISATRDAAADWFVEDIKSVAPLTEGDFLNSALGLFDGTTPSSSSTSGFYGVVNFNDYTVDGGGLYSNGHFGADSLFPGYSGYPLNLQPGLTSDDDDFAVRAIGCVVIPSSGIYTFGITSDDGGRLLIDGIQVFADANTHAASDAFIQVTLSAGEHHFEYTYFDRDFFATSELYAALGGHSSFNSAFRLIGDTANGGLQVLTCVPEPATMLGAGLGIVVCARPVSRRLRRSVRNS